jgi:nucleoside-diphosphate-sugar epimerase
MKTVLITGAAGNVGSQLRSEFAGRYKLRLSDKRLLRPSAGNVEAGPSNVL